MRNKLLHIINCGAGPLNTLILFLIMFDSGGGLGVRNLAFLFIFLFIGKSIFTKTIAFSKTFFFSLLLFSIFLLPGIITSFISYISIGTILGWIMGFVFVPFFYLYARSSNLNIDNFISAGKYFSIIIILLFFGRLFGIGPIVQFHNLLLPYMQGFFQDKHYISGSILPNVYFQGTLSLVICGVLAAFKKNSFAFILTLLVMAIAPSRFGFLVLSSAWVFFQVRRNPKFLMFIPVLICLLIFILSITPFGKELFSIFTGKSDGISIRREHTISVFNVINQNPVSFIFGSGPGSIFYSSGAPGYVSNIEISQLEFFRKYGIVSFIFFNIFYFLPAFFYKRIENGIYIPAVLFFYYLVSFSNPVLFSLFSMLFLSFTYIEIQKQSIDIYE